MTNNERIGTLHVPKKRRQTDRAFAEVDRPRRNEHAHRARRANHFAAFNAPIIAVNLCFGRRAASRRLIPQRQFDDRGHASRNLLPALPQSTVARRLRMAGRQPMTRRAIDSRGGQ